MPNNSVRILNQLVDELERERHRAALARDRDRASLFDTARAMVNRTQVEDLGQMRQELNRLRDIFNGTRARLADTDRRYKNYTDVIEYIELFIAVHLD